MRAVTITLVICLMATVFSQQPTQPKVEPTSKVEGREVFAEEEDENVYTVDEPLQQKLVENQVKPKQVEKKAVQIELPLEPSKPLHVQYFYQSIFVSLILIFLINYKNGKRSNQVIADRWVQSILPTVQQNFSLIGFGSQPSQQMQGVIMEQSAHQYTFYASGRQNLQFMEASIELRKREDLLTYYLLQFVFPEKDLVNIVIPMECQTPLVFCLSRKREMKSFKQKCPDLNFLTKDYEVAGLSQNYRILGENPQSINFIFDGYVVKHLNQLTNIVHSFHYTDQKIFNSSTGCIRIVLSATPLQMQKNQQAIKLVLYIVDRVAALKLPQAPKAKAEKAREAFAATKEKEQLEKKAQQIQKQKAQKRRLEEQRIRNLPPEKQRKALQKQKAKELKRLRGKVLKVM